MLLEPLVEWHEQERSLGLAPEGSVVIQVILGLLGATAARAGRRPNPSAADEGELSEA